MSGEHGEPFRADNRDLRDSKDGLIANVYLRSDAKRIAACLNALDGVTTEAIEAGAVSKLVEHCRALLNAYDGTDYGMAGLRDFLKPFAEVAND